MSPVGNAHTADGRLTQLTEHAELLVRVLVTFPLAVSVPGAKEGLAVGRRHETVFGQGSPGRMTVFPTLVAVEDLALFAQLGCRGLNPALAQLTMHIILLAFSVFVDYVLQDSIRRQFARAAVVQQNHFFTHRARDPETVSLHRVNPCPNPRAPDVAVRSTITHYSRVRLADHAQFVVHVGTAFVRRFGIFRICPRWVPRRSYRRIFGGCRVLELRRRCLDTLGTGQAEGVCTRQPHRVAIETTTEGTFQFVLHSAAQSRFTAVPLHLDYFARRLIQYIRTCHSIHSSLRYPTETVRFPLSLILQLLVKLCSIFFCPVAARRVN